VLHTAFLQLSRIFEIQDCLMKMRQTNIRSRNAVFEQQLSAHHVALCVCVCVWNWPRKSTSAAAVKTISRVLLKLRCYATVALCIHGLCYAGAYGNSLETRPTDERRIAAVYIGLYAVCFTRSFSCQLIHLSASSRSRIVLKHRPRCSVVDLS